MNKNKNKNNKKLPNSPDVASTSTSTSTSNSNIEQVPDLQDAPLFDGKILGTLHFPKSAFLDNHHGTLNHGELVPSLIPKTLQFFPLDPHIKYSSTPTKPTKVSKMRRKSNITVPESHWDSFTRNIVTDPKNFTKAPSILNNRYYFYLRESQTIIPAGFNHPLIDSHYILRRIGVLHDTEPEIFNLSSETLATELSNLSDSVPQDEMGSLDSGGGGRIDLTHLTTISIDPPNAQDLDDAISLSMVNSTTHQHYNISEFLSLPEKERKKTFYTQIGIHIADVSHYVVPDSPLDILGQTLQASIYTPYHTFHMLPAKLSEDLCSLKPGKPKRTFSFLFDFDLEKKYVIPGSQKFTKSLINSSCQLDYDHVDALLEGVGILRTNTESESESESPLNPDETQITTNNEKTGMGVANLCQQFPSFNKWEPNAANFQLHTAFEKRYSKILNQQFSSWKKLQSDLTSRSQTDIQIDDSMISIGKPSDSPPFTIPPVSIIHNGTTPQDIEFMVSKLYTISKSIEIARKKNINFARGDIYFEYAPGAPLPYNFFHKGRKPSNSIIETFMIEANSNAAKILIQRFPANSIICTHSKPKIFRNSNSNINSGRGQSESNFVVPKSSSSTFHFGLNSESYTHFSSPIRRYPDILVHRALQLALAGDFQTIGETNTTDIQLLPNDLVTTPNLPSSQQFQILCKDADTGRKLTNKAKTSSYRLFFAWYLDQRLKLAYSKNNPSLIVQTTATISNISVKRNLTVSLRFEIQGFGNYLSNGKLFLDQLAPEEVYYHQKILFVRNQTWFRPKMFMKGQIFDYPTTMQTNPPFKFSFSGSDKSLKNTESGSDTDTNNKDDDSWMDYDSSKDSLNQTHSRRKSKRHGGKHQHSKNVNHNNSTTNSHVNVNKGKKFKVAYKYSTKKPPKNLQCTRIVEGVTKFSVLIIPRPKSISSMQASFAVLPTGIMH